MNSFDPQRWQEDHRRQKIIGASSSLNVYGNTTNNKKTNMGKYNKIEGFLGLEDEDLVSSVVPAVTVVLEGRAICQRISLHNHGSYRSLAKALRQMFVDGDDDNDDHLDLSNAIPGHLIAYEDVENDLLLAGDLSWKFCTCGKENSDSSSEGGVKEIRYSKYKRGISYQYHHLNT